MRCTNTITLYENLTRIAGFLSGSYAICRSQWFGKMLTCLKSGRGMLQWSLTTWQLVGMFFGAGRMRCQNKLPCHSTGRVQLGQVYWICRTKVTILWRHPVPWECCFETPVPSLCFNKAINLFRLTWRPLESLLQATGLLWSMVPFQGLGVNRNLIQMQAPSQTWKSCACDMITDDMLLGVKYHVSYQIASTQHTKHVSLYCPCLACMPEPTIISADLYEDHLDWHEENMLWRVRLYFVCILLYKWAIPLLGLQPLVCLLGMQRL